MNNYSGIWKHYRQPIAAALFLTLFVSSNVAAAEPPMHPIKRFTVDAHGQYYLCKLSWEIAWLDETKMNDAFACIDKARTKVEASFKVAMATREAGVPAMRSLLKDFYAFSVSALGGLVPGASEPKIVYTSRIANIESEIGARRQRIDLEIDVP